MAILFLLSALAFIVGLKLLGSPKTARLGNSISLLAMLVAVAGTLIQEKILSLPMVWLALALGTAIGLLWSHRVRMTEMPQLVAILNGFGGLSSMLVGWSEAIDVYHSGWHFYILNNGLPAACWFRPFFLLMILLTVVVGAITFSGSFIAYGKLGGLFPTRSVQVPFRSWVALALGVAAGCFLFRSQYLVDLASLHVLIGLALLLGIIYTLPIGGGDMPVVISLLNSLSGVAAAMAGFVIGNILLIVAGCLVGASGIILTFIMCRSMNRSILRVIFGKLVRSGQPARFTADAEPQAISGEDAYYILEAARRVFIVPGYGMAVAQAQHAVKELADRLEANGAEISFVIHPVAGRMPGHMNVLLAEANVPYEQLLSMDQANGEMDRVDVAIVVGANDIVNTAAVDQSDSPIYGTPIVEVSRARTVLVLKRGQGRGFSGLENELFLRENTKMVYGNAKDTLAQLVVAFKND